MSGDHTTLPIQHEDAIDAAYRAADLLSRLAVDCPCPDKLKPPYEPHCYSQDFRIKDKIFCTSERARWCWASYIFGEIVAGERFEWKDNWQSIFRRRNERIKSLESSIATITKDRDAWRNRYQTLLKAVENLPYYLGEMIPQFIATQTEDGEEK